MSTLSLFRCHVLLGPQWRPGQTERTTCHLKPTSPRAPSRPTPGMRGRHNQRRASTTMPPHASIHPGVLRMRPRKRPGVSASAASPLHPRRCAEGSEWGVAAAAGPPSPAGGEWGACSSPPRCSRFGGHDVCGCHGNGRRAGGEPAGQRLLPAAAAPRWALPLGPGRGDVAKGAEEGESPPGLGASPGLALGSAEGSFVFLFLLTTSSEFLGAESLSVVNCCLLL